LGRVKGLLAGSLLLEMFVAPLTRPARSRWAGNYRGDGEIRFDSYMTFKRLVANVRVGAETCRRGSNWRTLGSPSQPYHLRRHLSHAGD